MDTSEKFPIRINRYLALQKISTRKGADELVSQGAVTINGRVAKLGDQVQKTDKVEVAEKVRKTSADFTYVAYYKPRGIVTHSPQEGEKDIAKVAGFPGLFPIGRLDKESEGLIILTNDGRVTDALLNPKSKHEKEYRVVVRENIPAKVADMLKRGVSNAGEKLHAKEAEVTGGQTIKIVLTEGKTHQVRRMLDVAHLTVEKLKRVRIMDIELGGLGSGESRKLTGVELEKFLKALGF